MVINIGKLEWINVRDHLRLYVLDNFKSRDQEDAMLIDSIILE